MTFYKSHKIKLYPTKTQEIFFKKSCGVARFSYNWALAKWKELLEYMFVITATQNLTEI
jgi:putative transposase